MAIPELIIGDTWQGEVAVVDAAGAPLDLTGATIEVQFRRPNGVTYIAATPTVIDAAGGLLRWTVPAETTASEAEGPVDYGVRVTTDGGTWTVLRGRLTIVRGPVRDEPVSP